LFRTLPQLHKWTEVYATPEVERLLEAPPKPPKVLVDLNPGTDWLEVRFDMEGIEEEEIAEILRHLREKKKYYKLPGGAYVSLEDENYAAIASMLEDMDIGSRDLDSARMLVPVMRGLRFLDPEEASPGVRLGQRFRELIDHIRNPESLEFPVPPQLSPILRDYQKYGYQWMKTLAHYHFGGILADDMGLGKTIQSIAFLLSELPRIREAGSPALIVCPASLTFNWLNELKKFAPDIHAVVMEGSKEARGGILEDLSGVDVLITSYPLLRRDAEAFADLEFSILILDEAQAIKNHATQTAQSVKEIRARHRFALTGTPVENRLEELWSIFDAVFPELFLSRRRFLELSPEQVARKVRPFLLRRRKTDVLKELPEKIETVQTSELTQEQKKLYIAYLARLQQEAIRRIREDGFQKSRMHILAGMTRLRQLCCHPALFVEGYEGGSGKLEQLLEIVESCRESGKRMLVFSQFTGMLGIIRGELERLGTSFFYLDGQTPGKERVDMCRRFNEGEGELFLISLKAGGTGLNLTGADTVLLFDLWWNPAVEQQAADRAHRIGQKNVVQVIRLVTRGTIEEKMYELQQRKRDLIDAVVTPGEDGLAALSEEDIRELLMI
jgi:SNF2 family DNA or RNA helicase